MTDAILNVDAIGVRFGGLAALDDVTFSVARGSIKGLIGPNGAGKSTLFNTISGNTAPSNGSIAFEGKRIDALPMARRAQLGIARTFQNLQLFTQQTVLENVMVGCHPRTRAGFVASVLRTPAQRREEREIHARSMAALERFGLANRAQRLAGTLSFGEAKIVEIARALVGEPSLMLLDEPVAGVPHGEVEQVITAIENVNRAGVSLLLVEHNLGFVMSLCDELVVLDHGCLIADGDAEQVVGDPAVLEAYLGEELSDA
ncbi:ABC transporter ATP-binding protein [Paraburkholderia sp. BCC1886]|uniref:ABC transporter ATP-binding protein n=1 Tax=Paraburkholderia sp. BCC1886 TaxID=2562670 RepID=UPI0011826C86|nr:ABC transporter ATP-binding protein [Paraburkholderia sp. BCC1886]